MNAPFPPAHTRDQQRGCRKANPVPSNTSPYSESLRAASPLYGRLAKGRIRLDQDVPELKVSQNDSHQPPSMSPITASHTLNQPVLDTLLKDMLLTLHNSLQAKFSSIRIYCQGPLTG